MLPGKGGLRSQMELSLSIWWPSRDCCCSVIQSCPTLGLQHATLLYASLHPRVCSNSCPLSWWCHPTHPLLPTFPAFNLSQHQGLFKWVNCSNEVAKVLQFQLQSVLLMNTQDWSPSGWTGCISLQSKGLSRAFFNTTVQRHQVFGTQLSSQSNSRIHTWPLEKP